jgi:HEPN domain-containing protein
MPRKQITGTSADWLKRAQSSLALAKITRPKDALWEDLCYHAQQAAEKALKAVLVEKKITFRFVHDINELIDTLEEHGQKTPEQVKRSVILTGYAVATRYPGNYEPVSKDEWKDAVTLADAVVSWAIRRINADCD